MSEQAPGADPTASAAEQASHIVFMTAQAVKAGSLAEADYEIEVEDSYGNKVKQSGTLRLKPFEMSPPNTPMIEYKEQG